MHHILQWSISSLRHVKWILRETCTILWPITRSLSLNKIILNLQFQNPVLFTFQYWKHQKIIKNCSASKNYKLPKFSPLIQELCSQTFSPALDPGIAHWSDCPANEALEHATPGAANTQNLNPNQTETSTTDDYAGLPCIHTSTCDLENISASWKAMSIETWKSPIKKCTISFLQ